MRIVTVVVFVLLPFLLGNSHPTAPPNGVRQLTGIDVSHHQRLIHWDTVAQRKQVHFAFVKATEGQDFTDTLFCHNWENLHRLGIRRGAYHFFRPQGCGDEQARHFLATIDMRPGDLAPVLDVETTDGMPPEIMLTEMRVWLSMVEARLGVRPIVYTNQFFYEKYFAGLFDQYPLWIARYAADRPILTNGKIWDFWQYDNRGCVDGISRRVDMNVFHGTPDMLDRFCWYPPEAAFLEAKVAP